MGKNVRVTQSMSACVNAVRRAVCSCKSDAPCVIIMCGCPASGKSTLTTALSHADFDGRITSVICPDTLRGMMAGDKADQSMNRQVWQKAYFELDRLTSMDGTVTIFDATASHVRDRHSIVKASNGAHCIVVWVDTPVSACLDRNERRDRHVPETVIRRMHGNIALNPPTEDDFVDGVIVFRQR